MFLSGKVFSRGMIQYASDRQPSPPGKGLTAFELLLKCTVDVKLQNRGEPGQLLEDLEGKTGELTGPGDPFLQIGTRIPYKGVIAEIIETMPLGDYILYKYMLHYEG